MRQIRARPVKNGSSYHGKKKRVKVFGPDPTALTPSAGALFWAQWLGVARGVFATEGSVHVATGGEEPQQG
jgi:hypothetical protein